MYAEWSKVNQYFRTWKKYASKKRLIIFRKILLLWQNSLTFPRHWSNGQNSLTFFQNSLTIPWPGENFVFPWLFPDTWQPCEYHNSSDTLPYTVWVSVNHVIFFGCIASHCLQTAIQETWQIYLKFNKGRWEISSIYSTEVQRPSKVISQDFRLVFTFRFDPRSHSILFISMLEVEKRHMYNIKYHLNERKCLNSNFVTDQSKIQE